jgi:hypothetical protein
MVSLLERRVAAAVILSGFFFMVLDISLMLTLIRCWVVYRAHLALSVYRVRSRFEPEYAALSAQIVRRAGEKCVLRPAR